MTIKLRLVKLERREDSKPSFDAGAAMQELQNGFARLRERMGNEYHPSPSLAEVMAGANCSAEARQRLRDFLRERGITNEHVAVITGRSLPDVQALLGERPAF